MLKLSTMTASSLLKKLNCRNTPLIPKFTKLSKFVFFSLILTLAVFTATAIFAQNSIPNEIPNETKSAFLKKQAAINDNNNQESWMNSAASSNTMVGINALTGDIPPEVLNADPNKPPTNWIPGGIIGFNNRNIASLYNPPFSGIEYLASIKNNFLGKPAYAQGVGFQGLSALLPLWRGFRNVTYTIFSIIFVIMGIMIMLRVKISPQAVITIQNSIPKLITALILVTFSYAIVGLLIDLSSLIEGLGISLILNASGNTATTNVTDILQNPNTIGKIMAITPMGALTLLAGIIGGIVLVIFFIGQHYVMGVFAFGIILLIPILMVVFYTIKFFFGLLKCYINILIKTVIGPLEIALGAIPNMKMGFGSWFTDIVANILVFPISMIFLIMVKVLMDAIADNNLWTPPGLDFLSSNSYLISIAIGIGGLMIVSKLPSLIPEFIFKIKPSPFGKAIGEGLTSIPGYKSIQKGASEKFGNAVSNTFTSPFAKELAKRRLQRSINSQHEEAIGMNQAYDMGHKKATNSFKNQQAAAVKDKEPTQNKSPGLGQSQNKK